MPFIKYNAKNGQWSIRVDKDQPDVIIANPRFAMDMANVKQGWMIFGVSGLQAWWWERGVRTAMPDGIQGVKDGFQIVLHGPDPQPALGNKPIGLRQWTSNAGSTKEGFCRAYDEWEANAGQHPNELPIFQMTGTETIPGAQGNNYAPVFALTGWVERAKIPEFDAHKATETQSSEPAYGSGTGIVPPATQPWPGPPGDDDLNDEIPY